MTQWIDTHVHIFTAETAGDTPVAIHGGINDVATYTKHLKGNLPAGTVIVDFSKAVTSDHVLATVKPLAEAGIPAKGIIRGNIADSRTFDWIARPEIAGIRLYGKAEIPDFAADKAAWDKLFSLCRQYDKHVCLFGDSDKVRQIVEQLPNDLTLLIDHIGMPDAAAGANQHDYAQLLSVLEARHKQGQEVYFKGPGYRTSFEVSRILPFLEQIAEKFGESQILLGASDAPFAGPVVETGSKYSGQANQAVIGYETILPYLNSLIEALAKSRNKSFEMLQMQLLYSNAQKLYQFDKAKQAAA